MKRDPSATEGTPGLGDQYKDERTEKKIHDHLNNENDVITEQDIANAPTGLVNKELVNKEEVAQQEDIPAEPKEELTGENKTAEDKVKDNTDPGIETSWNVLES